jgi:hypothetical protein
VQSGHTIVLDDVSMGGIVAPADPTIVTDGSPQHGIEDRPPRQEYHVVPVPRAEVWGDLTDAASRHRLKHIGHFGPQNPGDSGLEEMCVHGVRHPGALPAVGAAVDRILIDRFVAFDDGDLELTSSQHERSQKPDNAAATNHDLRHRSPLTRTPCAQN